MLTLRFGQKESPLILGAISLNCYILVNNKRILTIKNKTLMAKISFKTKAVPNRIFNNIIMQKKNREQEKIGGIHCLRLFHRLL